MIGIYFQSWSSKWSSSDLDLASTDGDIIYLSFVKPSCQYRSGQHTFLGTGLDFSSDFKVVQSAIRVLKSKNKIVMLSVGGATYPFDSLNVDGVVALAKDLECDGIDIDWEPTTKASGEFANIINRFAEKKLRYLSAAVFSIGAFGVNEWTNAQPQGMYTGLNRQGLIEAGHRLDWINIMAYDAGDTFNPTEAFMAYKAIFKNKIYLGFEVGQQAWGGALLTLDQVKLWGQFVKNQGGHYFIWSWQKQGNPSVLDVIKVLKTLGSVSEPPKNDDTVDSSPIEIPTPTLEPINCKCTCHQSDIEWKPWTFYKQNQMVSFQGKMFTCRQTHTSQPDWVPSQTLALWK
jgi:chitinase